MYAPIGQDVLAQAAQGYVSIGYKPHGFWSDVITVRFKRDWSEEGKWTREISWSSGGRDPEELADDFDAMEEFIKALTDAKQFVKENFIPEALEEAYQSAVRAREESAAAIVAEHRARVAADPGMGMAAAKGLVEDLERRARAQPGITHVVEFRHRGTEHVGRVTAVCSARPGVRKTLTFYKAGDRMGKETVIARLADGVIV